MRIIPILILVLLFWLLWRAIKPKKSSRTQNTAGSKMMRQCAHCQVHIPENEAVVRGGKIYCSEQHARLS